MIIENTTIKVDVFNPENNQHVITFKLDKDDIGKTFTIKLNEDESIDVNCL